jgi:twitching motility protein PilT
MRVIETMLGIVDMKRADGLELALDEVPALLLSAGRQALTMPALSLDMMEHVLSDLLDLEQRAALRELGKVDATYRSSTYGTYDVHARASNDKPVITLRRLASEVRKSSIASPPLPKAPLAKAREPVLVDAHGSEREQNIAGSSSGQAARTDAVVTERPLDRALDEAIARRASDVIISSGRAPLLRVDGALLECQEAAPSPAAAIEAYVLSQLGAEGQRMLESTGSVDFALKHLDAAGEQVRFRANAFRHDGGVAIALRPILTEIPKLTDLHLPASLAQLVEQRTGLVLFTGATGSGKSTTLAALLEHINRSRAAHIVTLEDPIEYVYRPRRSIFHQREVGQHVDGFANGLRAALRENPDVLLVGEMRDPETIRMTLTAAQTGHLVLSTIHSSNVVMAIDRLIDGFPESEKSHVRHALAASLRHIVAQQLVPATGGGRLPVLEILTVNHAVAAQIREGRTHMVATQLETGADEGMVPMARSLASLVRAGRVARAVALAACEQRETLEKLLGDGVGARPRQGG